MKTLVVRSKSTNISKDNPKIVSIPTPYMTNKKLWALLPLILFSIFATADGDKTRGIGRYPGRNSEAHIPQRSLPQGYANQAWMQTAWASP